MELKRGWYRTTPFFTPVATHAAPRQRRGAASAAAVATHGWRLRSSLPRTSSWLTLAHGDQSFTPTSTLRTSGAAIPACTDVGSSSGTVSAPPTFPSELWMLPPRESSGRAGHPGSWRRPQIAGQRPALRRHRGRRQSAVSARCDRLTVRAHTSPARQLRRALVPVRDR